MIVKVQLPLAGDPMAFVYSEDRSISLYVPASAVTRRFGGEEKKLFFHAEIVGDQLELGERAPWQKW